MTSLRPSAMGSHASHGSHVISPTRSSNHILPLLNGSPSCRRHKRSIECSHAVSHRSFNFRVFIQFLSIARPFVPQATTRPFWALIPLNRASNCVVEIGGRHRETLGADEPRIDQGASASFDAIPPPVCRLQFT